MEADKTSIEEELIASDYGAAHNLGLLSSLSIECDLSIVLERVALLSDEELTAAHIDLLRMKVDIGGVSVQE